MKQYPHLAEMGIRHPAQIKQFSVNSINYIDALRITYERPKGSHLPSSRTYTFPRVKRTVNVGADGGEGATVMETNPDLTAALAELRQICEKRQHNGSLASEILEEIRLLEEDIAMRGEHIKTLVARIKTDD